MTTDRGNERRFDRSSWVTVGIVLLFFIWTLPLATALMRMPTDGCLLDTSNLEAPVVTTCFGSWPTPLHSGDRVLQVAGASAAFDITNYLPKLPPPGWTDGGIARYTVRRDAQPLDLDVPLHTMDLSDAARGLSYRIWNDAATDLLIALLAIGIFALRPRSRAAQLLLVASAISILSQSMLWAGNTIGGNYTDAQPAIWITESIPVFQAGWVYQPALLLLALSFPRRVWPITRWPRLVPALIFGIGFGAVLASLITGNFGIFLIELGLYAVLLIVAFATVTVHTALRVRDPVVRAQAAWMGLGFVTYCSTVVLWATLNIVPGGSAWFSDNKLLLTVFGALSTLTLPLCLGIAITRYRLFDIDIVINRTLVYSTLTVCVVGGYALLVALLGQLFQAQGNFLVSLAGTGVVALVFQPLRDRLQRAVNRLMYGRRDEPYQALSQLGQRLETSLGPEAVLTVIVETIAATLKLPAVAIAIGQGDGERIAAAVGDLSAAAHQTALPLSYQSEKVGRLLFIPRRGERTLSRADRSLLDDLARQAGIAVHAVRLSADLQHSRERLVNAREEERRRLRRDLHDGLGPTLASIAQRIEVAAHLIPTDPVHSTALLQELEGQVRATIGDIRRLVYDLRPPTLDQHGLLGAIRIEVAHWQEGPLQLSVEASDLLPPLPAAVEVAAYRIVQEAVTNVMRHAQAQRCTIRLWQAADGGWLEVEIVDDGRGLPAEYRAGVGLNAMRERVEELGGLWRIEQNGPCGTRVSARLPLPYEMAGVDPELIH